MTHVFKGVVSTTANADDALAVDWTDISGNMPDVPATDVLRVGDRLVVGTDYGVIVSGLNGGTWTRVGASPGSSAAALPLTTVYDLTLGPDGYLYAATHGRASGGRIWPPPCRAGRRGPARPSGAARRSAMVGRMRTGLLLTGPR